MGKHAGPWNGAAQSRVIQAAPEQGLSKSRERIQAAPHLVELDGKAFTIIRAKSLNELTAVWVPSPQSFPYRSLAFWNKFGSMPTE